MSAQRFIVENDGPNLSAVRTLFEQAATLCLRNAIPSITLVVPVKAAFPSTVIADYLGTSIARCLSRGASMTLVKGLELHLAIPEQLSRDADAGLVLAAFLSLDDLALIDAAPSLKALAFLPWTEDEGKRWMSLWMPAVWGESTWQVEPYSLPEPVEHELARLTRVVNLSTGLKDPRDQESALRIFKGFRLDGYHLDAGHIKGWAIQHGWAARHADDLARLSRKYCA